MCQERREPLQPRHPEPGHEPQHPDGPPHQGRPPHLGLGQDDRGHGGSRYSC